MKRPVYFEINTSNKQHLMWRRTFEKSREFLKQLNK